MTTSLVDAESLLALEIGSVTTRAVLFDVVEDAIAIWEQALLPLQRRTLP
jgi:hypothetical protein